MSECKRGWVSGPGGRFLLALGLGLSGSTLGCRVPPPTPQAVLRYGFGSPGQAFRSFATAVQGRMLDALYDSLSGGFKARNGLSRTGFGEAWDQLEDENPFLRYALYQATKDPSELTFERPRGGDWCTVQTTYRGHALEIQLVRTGYWELHVEDPENPAADPIREQDGAVEDLFQGLPGGMRLSKDGKNLFALSPLPHGDLPSLSRLQAGYEWKIDNFVFVKL